MTRRPAPAPTPAVAAVAGAGVAHRLHAYRHDPAVASYGREAAAALGVEEARVFKTLVASAGAGLVVAVVPVSHDLDLKALAAVLGVKSATMADTRTAERSTGYVVGGISPIGYRRPLPTIIDASASTWTTVFVSAGRRGLELEVGPEDLLRLTGGRRTAIARPR